MTVYQNCLRNIKLKSVLIYLIRNIAYRRLIFINFPCDQFTVKIYQIFVILKRFQFIFCLFSTICGSVYYYHLIVLTYLAFYGI